MKPISQNRKPRSVFRLDPPLCALPPNKVPLPDPESVPTAITFYFNHPVARQNSNCTSKVILKGVSPPDMG